MDWIDITFAVVNFINLVILLPVAYPFFRILGGWCACALDVDFMIIGVYLFITVATLVLSIVTSLEILYLSNRISRIIIVAYFLLTFVFVEASTRYINKKRDECECFKDEYKKWLTSLTMVRWIGVYFFGVVLMSAGLFLFIRSNQQPFSFPRSIKRSYTPV